ncbi:MAG: DUF2271 domain-containing protein [Psychrobium sp.]|nr:DUF2271 domain-containing protein [Psychrobium sp.]
MNKNILITLAALSLLFTVASQATTLTVDFSLPQFDKQDYRKPYVAMWAETKGNSDNLLLWHLTKRDNDKWLVDIRRWWRKEGRYSDNKFDGTTGATKGAGQHQVQLDIGDLTKFTLMIEVVRQKGGRSLVRKKIDLSNTNSLYNIAPSDEIGAITIKVNN